MKRVVLSLFIFIALINCQLNKVKNSRIENYLLKEEDNSWALNGIGYYIEVEKFIDSDGNGIGDIKGIINNINYFKANEINSLDIDFIILGDIFLEDNKFNKKVGTYSDLLNLIKIADKNNIKILTDITFDLDNNTNYYPLMEEKVLKGIAGFRLNFKNLNNNSDLIAFFNAIKELKDKYKYLFIFCTLDKKYIPLLKNSNLDAIQYSNENITNIEFNNDFNSIINFVFNDSKNKTILPKLLFTLPQIPVIKYKDEFGNLELDSISIQDAIKKPDKNKTFLLYKEIIKLRKKFSININSKFIFHSDDNNTFSFFIKNQDKKYLLFINKNPYVSLCYLRNGEWLKEIDTTNGKEFVLVELYGDSVNTKYYIPKNNLGIFCNIKDSGIKVFEIIEK